MRLDFFVGKIRNVYRPPIVLKNDKGNARPISLCGFDAERMASACAFRATLGLLKS